MIKLNIDNKTYSLPNSHKEINYQLGRKVENILIDFETIDIEAKKWVMAALIGTEYDVIDMVVDEQVQLIMDNHIIFSDNMITNNKYIMINHVLYKYKGLDNSISVEEYAIRELCIVNEEYEDLFYRLYDKVKWYQHPIRRILIKNNKEFNLTNYYEIKLSIHQYLVWIGDLIKEYSISDVNENIPEDQQSDEIIKSPTESFGIYNIIMKLTNNNLIEYKEWLNEDIKSLFKFILYRTVDSQNQTNS